MKVYFDALLHTRSFMQSDPGVSRNQFAKFTEGMHLQEIYPGLLALCYIEKIDPREITKHLQKVHAESFKDYKIWSESSFTFRLLI